MAKIYCICTAFYLLLAGFTTQHDRNTLTAAAQIVSLASKEVGVKELTGNNDGLRVEQYLAYTGHKKGDPWCASFLSWVFGQAGYSQPKTAWSPALFPKSRSTKTILLGTVFGLYFADKGRIAHAGLVAERQGDWLHTIEGNTNVIGSRDGDGVYRKIRHIRTVGYYADWIGAEKEGRP